MLFGLGPAEMLVCLVPLFLVIAVTGIWLFVSEQKNRRSR
jgi:hypothetical protein